MGTTFVAPLPMPKHGLGPPTANSFHRNQTQSYCLQHSSLWSKIHIYHTCCLKQVFHHNPTLTIARGLPSSSSLTSVLLQPGPGSICNIQGRTSHHSWTKKHTLPTTTYIFPSTLLPSVLTRTLAHWKWRQNVLFSSMPTKYPHKSPNFPNKFLSWRWTSNPIVLT